MFFPDSLMSLGFRWKVKSVWALTSALGLKQITDCEKVQCFHGIKIMTLLLQFINCWVFSIGIKGLTIVNTKAAGMTLFNSTVQFARTHTHTGQT